MGIYLKYTFRFNLTDKMVDKVDNNQKLANLDDLIDFEDYEDNNPIEQNGKEKKLVDNKNVTTHTGVHSAGFKDFLLKNELNRAIVDCGFEQPSAV